MITESKLSIAIVTGDENYLNMVTASLRKDKELTVSGFSSPKTLFDSNIFFQIILVDEELFDEELKNRCISIIVLSENIDDAKTYEDVECIDKYKRVDHIYRFALSDYANKKKRALDSKRSYIRAVYSPAGGCGVSTIALAASYRAARMGMRTLYLNLEDVPTQTLVIPNVAEAKGISDLAADLDEKMNLNARVASLLQRQEDNLYNFNIWENISDIRAMNETDTEKLITILSESGNFDLIIIDMANALSVKTIKVFDIADEILMVTNDSDVSLFKINVLLSNQFIANNYLRKIKIVVNKFQGGSEIALPIAEYGTVPLLSQMTTPQIVSYLSVSQDFAYLANVLSS
jgi:Mrp family chromosome partitioning ATPase